MYLSILTEKISNNDLIERLYNTVDLKTYVHRRQLRQFSSRYRSIGVNLYRSLMNYFTYPYSFSFSVRKFYRSHSYHDCFNYIEGSTCLTRVILYN